MTSDFRNWLMQLFSKQVYYFNGQLYQFVTRQGVVLLEPSSEKSPKIVIVSPKYVTAENEQYPVVNKKELNKILSLKGTANTRYVVVNVNKEGAHVTKYEYKEGIPNTWIKVPETEVLGQFVNEEKVLELEHAESSWHYYLAKSGGQLKYIPKIGLISNLERVKVATGISAKNQEFVSWADKAQLLKAGLFCFNEYKLVPFLPQRVDVDWQKLLISVLAPSVGVAFIYMGVVSAGLLFQQHYLQTQTASYSENLGNLLDLQTEFDNNATRYEQLRQFVTELSPTIGLWEVMAPLYESLDIDSITLKGEQFVLRAQADSATDTLEKFRQLPQVDNAKFDSPISNVRYGERFSISFTLKDATSVE
ncbi:hypothetical protein PSECIP111951_00677 [Pseudoalteromonas holothuriae]|uniref:Type II secretion system protein L n=1 Tax=Pseudoalteromonas holothuriae TaxID=2963714 RepID=A0ABM9GGB1_9GAMM|nr:hypothetical protein [Pseudoalteromonas sp. CIP111951]CAH9052726.1 hypothetical protein PSECIP111951_00677 [Pseudoalteromonas sp. CIP111951]